MKKIDDEVDFTETEEFADAFIDSVCGGGGDVADEVSAFGGVVLSKPKKPKKKTMVNFFQPRLPMMEG